MNARGNYLRPRVKPRPLGAVAPLSTSTPIPQSPHYVHAFNPYSGNWKGHIFGEENQIIRDLENRGWRVKLIFKGKREIEE